MKRYLLHHFLSSNEFKAIDENTTTASNRDDYTATEVFNQVVLNWLSKWSIESYIITLLRLPRSVIGFNILRQILNQWEARQSQLDLVRAIFSALWWS